MSKYSEHIQKGLINKQRKDEEERLAKEKRQRERELDTSKARAFYTEVVIKELNQAKEDLQNAGILAEVGDASGGNMLRHTLRLPNNTPTALVFSLTLDESHVGPRLRYDIKYTVEQEDQLAICEQEIEAVEQLISGFISKAL